MVDELDIQILKILKKDARLSYREISKRLNVAAGTVQHRISRMEKDGTIGDYHAHLDYSKIGYNISALIGMMIRRPDMVSVEAELAKCKNVVGLYDVTGEFDIIIAARFKSLSDLDYFIKNSLSSPSIEKTTTFLVLKTIKEKNTLLE
jgi:DNA-binding Lrp family transcriptional regulator